MVSRINNTTRRYYNILQKTKVLPKTEDSIFLPNALPESWADIKCPPPLIAQAQKVLLHRLKIIDDDTFELDGQPASIRQVVDAVNKYVRQMGGKYLQYPGVNLNYQEGQQMRINVPLDF